MEVRAAFTDAGWSGVHLLQLLLVGYGLLECQRLVETLISLCGWTARSKLRVDMDSWAEARTSGRSLKKGAMPKAGNRAGKMGICELRL